MFKVLVLLFIIKFYACGNVKQNETKQSKIKKQKQKTYIFPATTRFAWLTRMVIVASLIL